jgi:hypothetical protein
MKASKKQDEPNDFSDAQRSDKCGVTHPVRPLPQIDTADEPNDQGDDGDDRKPDLRVHLSSKVACLAEHATCCCVQHTHHAP